MVMTVESVVCYSGDLTSPPVHWSLCTWPTPSLFEPLVRQNWSLVHGSQHGLALGWQQPTPLCVPGHSHASICTVRWVHYSQISGAGACLPGEKRDPRQPGSWMAGAGPAGDVQAQHSGRWVAEVNFISEEVGGRASEQGPWEQSLIFEI